MPKFRCFKRDMLQHRTTSATGRCVGRETFPPLAGCAFGAELPWVAPPPPWRGASAVCLCRGRELNSHPFRDRILNPACLPISPPRQQVITLPYFPILNVRGEKNNAPLSGALGRLASRGGHPPRLKILNRSTLRRRSRWAGRQPHGKAYQTLGHHCHQNTNKPVHNLVARLGNFIRLAVGSNKSEPRPKEKPHSNHQKDREKPVGKKADRVFRVSVGYRSNR